METSAKTAYNVKSAFTNLINGMYMTSDMPKHVNYHKLTPTENEKAIRIQEVRRTY